MRFLFLLVLFAPCISAVSTSVMKARTGFLRVTCDANSNKYIYNVQNGYVLPLDTTVSLDCEGTDAVSSNFIINAQANSTDRTIGPPNVSIQNRVCVISVSGTNSLITEPTTFQTISSTCGSIIRDGNDGSATCDYPDFPCMFDTGDWWHNSFSWFIIYVGAIALAILMFGSIFTVMYVQEHQRFLAQIKNKGDIASSKSVIENYDISPPALDANGMPKAGMSELSNEQRLDAIRAAHHSGQAHMGASDMNSVQRAVGGYHMADTSYEQPRKSWLYNFLFGKGTHSSASAQKKKDAAVSFHVIDQGESVKGPHSNGEAVFKTIAAATRLPDSHDNEETFTTFAIPSPNSTLINRNHTKTGGDTMSIDIRDSECDQPAVRHGGKGKISMTKIMSDLNYK